MTPNSLRRAAAAAAAARNPSKRLLDDGDMNIGNSLIVSPVGGPVITFPTQNPPRILKLDADSRTGQMVTVALGASVNDPNAAGHLPGVFTGILEFGNGGHSLKAEIDIPVGPIQLVGGLRIQPISGGVMVTVPGGTLRVYARNDANLVSPDASGSIPVGALPPADPDFTPIVATAVAAYFSQRVVRSPTKTLWIARAPVGGPVVASGVYGIPAFATGVRVLRPVAVAVTLNLFDSAGNNIDAITIGAGTSSPTLPIPGTATFISVGATVPASKSLSLAFDIGL